MTCQRCGSHDATSLHGETGPGTALFAASSLACGLADNQGLLVGARLAQGFGAAMMSPAALSILTTTCQGSDRHKALGVWAGISGMASAAGLFFGWLLTQDFGWRWVFFVNLPLCTVVLLLIFTMVKAPDQGWGAGPTVGGLAASAVLVAAFGVNEQRRAHPLVPLSIFRIKGLAAADATQVIAWAGFYSMFFFVTLYMQNVLEGWRKSSYSDGNGGNCVETASGSGVVLVRDTANRSGMPLAFTTAA
jgi:MFS family permease